MSLSSTRRPEPYAGRSGALSESIGHGLVDLFRALVPIVAAGPGSPRPGNTPASKTFTQPEQILTAYFSVSSAGLCILDTEFRYVAINQTMAEMNGVSAAEHLGKTVGEVLGDFTEVVEPQVRRVLATGQPLLNIEISFLLHNRTDPGHWIEHYIPIKDAAGKVTQVGVVAVEITEQKRLEQSLHRVSQKLKDEKKRLQVVSEVSRVLAAQLDVRRAFANISAYLRHVLRQEYAALALRDEESGQLVRQAMDFPLGKSITIGGKISTAKGPGGKALEQRSSLIFTYDQIQGFEPGIAASFTAEGIKSLCCVPLLRRKAPLGVLVLGSTRADAFNSDDLTLLNQVAS